MPGQFTIRHATVERDSFGNYVYDILKDAEVVATYWHDFRGDEHGIKFADGTTESWPVGRVPDFIHGGGPEPLRLSPAAIEWLEQRFSQ